jgi:lysophospholipase L1-like esterase
MAWEQIEDTNLTFGGSWQARQVNNSNYSAGSRMVSTFGSTTSYWEYSGYFQGFKIYSNLSPQYGIANVYIDGILVGTYDLYAAASTSKHLQFTGTCTPGWHTIRVQQSGTKNAASTDYYLDADYIQVDMVAPQANGKPIRVFNHIMAFGDSITYGLACSARDKRFGEIVQRMLGVPVSIQGLSGLNIGQIKGYIDELVVPRQPDLVLWLACANDGASGIQNSMQDALDYLWSKLPRTEVVLASFTDNTANATAENQARLVALQAAAAAKGCLCVDNYTATVGNTGQLLADNIHPNDSGHIILAAGFKAAIDQYYRGTKTKRTA